MSKKVDGTYDLFEVLASAEPRIVRTDLPSLNVAREIARSDLTGDRLWYCHHSAPDILEPL